MAQLQALCMKCRNDENAEQMQDMEDISIEENDNGRFSARGTCGRCGGNMFKFLSKEDAEKLKSEGAGEYKKAA